MIILFQLISALDIDTDHVYLIKVAGDDGRFVTRIGSTIRTILAKDFDAITGAENLIRIVESSKYKGKDVYSLQFIQQTLTGMPYSNGVIAQTKPKHEFGLFKIARNGTSFIFFNGVFDECLVQTNNYDEKLKGYRLNLRRCNDTRFISHFSLIDAGTDNSKDNNIKNLCAVNGYVMSNIK